MFSYWDVICVTFKFSGSIWCFESRLLVQGCLHHFPRGPMNSDSMLAQGSQCYDPNSYKSEFPLRGVGGLEPEGHKHVHTH